MSSSADPSPVNPLPPAVAALFLAIMGIECVFVLGERGLVGGPEAVGWRLSAMQTYAFSPDVFNWMLANGIWPPEHIVRFFSYPFVHAGFTHALIAGVLLLAMGKVVGEVFGSAAMVLIFVLSGVVGSVCYALLLGDPRPLVGAFPPVYGLIGAFTFILWRSLGNIGANQSRAFTLIAFLMGIQLVFGLLFGADADWVADLAGFATGFGLSFLVAPGGWARLRNRIRHD